MPLNIPKTEFAALSDAIADAFPTPPDLDGVLHSLNDSIQNYGGLYTTYPLVCTKTIEQYNARWNIDKLLRAMLAQRPDNGLLATYAWRKGVAFAPPNATADVGTESDGLERMLDPVRGFQDVGSLLFHLGRIANAICQISVPLVNGVEYGTGFLIGKQTVLTNWHVVQHVTPNNRKGVKVRFDFRTGPDGKTPMTETLHALLDHDTDWLIDHSPYHSSDLGAEPKDARLARQLPEDDLDYAVLRLAGSPGTDVIGPKGQQRPHLRLPEGAEDPTEFDATAGLFLVQHPYDPKAKAVLPLQLDWQKPAFLGKNASGTSGTRVLYEVNTRKGSSGSPCFNAKFGLIALHHAGGKDWPADVPYLYNQGIPILRISALLKKRDKWKDVV
jgi:hypothetical protein